MEFRLSEDQIALRDARLVDAAVVQQRVDVVQPCTGVAVVADRIVRDLLAEVLRIPEGREYVVSNAGDDFRGRTENAPADEIARLYIEGEESSGGELAALVNEFGG